MGTFKIPNAKKWTLQRVTSELCAIRYATEKQEVSCIESALSRQGLYRQLWNYWKIIFKDNDDIMECILIIETMFQARVVDGMIRKKVPPSVGNFILRYSYKWNDKPDPVAEGNYDVQALWLGDGKVYLADATCFEHCGFYALDPNPPTGLEGDEPRETPENQ